MQGVLDTTNLAAAALNLVVAALIFIQVRRLHASSSRLAVVLGCFFLFRGVDRLTGQGAPLILDDLSPRSQENSQTHARR